MAKKKDKSKPKIKSKAKGRRPKAKQRPRKNPPLVIAFKNGRKSKRKAVGSRRKAKSKSKKSLRPTAYSKKRVAKVRMSNPEANYDAEIEQFEDFQGRAAEKLTKIADEIYIQDKFALLGDCCEINFVENMHGEKFDENGLLWDRSYPKLCTNGEGTQLYLFGGDQNAIEYARKHGLDTSKDMVDLGSIHSVVYRTRKAQAKFKDATYEHEFGDEGGDLPRGMFDVKNKRIHFVGGDYEIRPEGITG